jgi:hypothetical protein
MGFACYQADYLFKPYGAIKSYLPGIRHLCDLVGASTDAFSNKQLALVMRSIRRDCPSTKRPKRLAITVSVLSDMLLLLDPNRYDHAVLWTALTIAVYGLLRAGEMTLKKTEHDDGSILLRSDITWGEDHFVIHLRASKTDVFREGVDIVIHRNGTLSCPFAALKALWDASPRQEAHAPLLQDNLGQPYKYTSFHAGIKVLAEQLKFDPAAFGTHSCRIGGATTLALLGYPATVIMTLGRWKSDCYRRYLRLNVADFAIYSKAMASSAKLPHFGKLTLSQASMLTVDDLKSTFNLQA